MLRGQTRFGWGRRPDAVDVHRLLRLEAADARVEPTAGLRRRTLDALRDASLNPAPARRRPLAFTYAAACGVLAVIAASAALHLDRQPIAPAAPAGVRARLAPTRLLNLDRFESPLKAEVRLLVADARHARDRLLCSLPRPPRGG